MKTIIKALFLLIALTATVPVFAQFDYEAVKARAEAGEAEAQLMLGYMYIDGDGTAKK